MATTDLKSLLKLTHYRWILLFASNYYNTPDIFQACHYHAEKGLKKEPNDTGGPDLNTKILELQVAIRNSEREKVSKWCVTQCLQSSIFLLAAPTSKGNFFIDTVVITLNSKIAISSPGEGRGEIEQVA